MAPADQRVGAVTVDSQGLAVLLGLMFGKAGKRPSGNGETVMGGCLVVPSVIVGTDEASLKMQQIIFERGS